MLQQLYCEAHKLWCCRDVFLLAKPSSYISDYFVHTPLQISVDDAKLQGARWGTRQSSALPGAGSLASMVTAFRAPVPLAPRTPICCDTLRRLSTAYIVWAAWGDVPLLQ